MKFHNPKWKTHRVKEVFQLPEDSVVKVSGWVHTVRDLGGIVFLILRDSDGLIQVVASKSDLGNEYFEKFRELRPETVVSIEGRVKKSSKAPGGVEIRASSVEILNRASVPLHLEPAGRSKLTLDERLDNRVIDLRKPRNMAIFKFQSALLKYMREFLNENGFIEVFTPKLIATATEGGAALFPIAYFDM